MSSIALIWITLVSTAAAHEVLPAIGDMTRTEDGLVFEVRLNAESFVAGIDQTTVADTDDAPEAEEYDRLRALEPAELESTFGASWPAIANEIDIVVDGAAAPLSLLSVVADPIGDVEQPRTTTVTFQADLAEDAQKVSVGWASGFGTLVIRQMGVEAPYDGYLEAGAVSPEISLSGGDQAGGWQTFVNYIPVGFDHIVPKGLDHILFVLGLFFLSSRMGPLLWQISAFTLAHTITLALASLGYVSIPPSIVEPLIALSIVYVAVENIFNDGLSPWRPLIIFGFGLLHGLGFASVLAEFGLPQASFIPALIGFNIGVELGQIAVIIVAYLCVMRAIQMSETGKASKIAAATYLLAMVLAVALVVPVAQAGALEDLAPLIVAVGLLLGFSAASVSVGRFDSYREIVAMPGSIIIAVVAAYWCFERVFL